MEACRRPTRLIHRQAPPTHIHSRATSGRLRCPPACAVKKTETKPNPSLKRKDLKLSTAASWGRKLPVADSEGPPQGWGLLDLQTYNRKWEIPWGPITTLAGMGMWGLSFRWIGFELVPKLCIWAGVDLGNATAGDKATFTLALQLLQTLVGIGVVRVFADRYRNRPEADTPPPLADATAAPRARPSSSSSSSSQQGDELFNYSPLQPFRSPDGWLFWGILGVLASPFVVGTVAYTVSAIGYDKLFSETRGTVDSIAPIISADSTTYLSLLAVTGGLAPLLEETVFRGFLLTSLTKYFPTWFAVLGSSVCFGAAHLSARDFPVLTGLGILLGFSYVRSRNLLTPMLIHGAWNSTVLSVLFYLASNGIDLQQLLREAQPDL